MLKKNERITITLSTEQLELIDFFVGIDFLYENRSQFIRAAISDYTSRLLLEKKTSLDKQKL